MAEALVIGITDLFFELLAHALGVLRPLQAAGAVAPGAFKTLPDGFDNFLIWVQNYFHKMHLPLLIIIPIIAFYLYFSIANATLFENPAE